jgi:hypothetical protein
MQSTSKIGSKTSFMDAWTNRSATAATPKRRRLPPAFAGEQSEAQRPQSPAAGSAARAGTGDLRQSG